MICIRSDLKICFRESPTKENAVSKSVPIEVKKEWLRPGYTLERAVYDKTVMAAFREYLISIQARESLAFWLETGNVHHIIIYYGSHHATIFALIIN